MSEFSRTYDPRLLPGSTVELTADETERAALAKRFDLVRTECLDVIGREASDLCACDAFDLGCCQVRQLVGTQTCHGRIVDGGNLCTA